MKTFAAGLAFALLAIGAPFAQSASNTTINQRLRRIERQIRLIKADLKTTKARVLCVRMAAPLTRYGDATNHKSGYSFSSDGVNFFFTTALDFTAKDQKPEIYAALIDPKCIPGSSATRRFVPIQGLTPH
jgi:hypothetical protein